MMKVYLDNNRKTKLDPQVKEVVHSVLEITAGDICAPHYAGAESRRIYGEAMEKIRLSVSASDRDLVLPAPSADFALRSLFMDIYVNTILTGKRSTVIVDRRAGGAVSAMAQFLQKQGCRLVRLPVNRDGVLEPGALEEYITPRTAMVSVGMADMETGAVNPVAQFAEICRKYDVPLHCDASSAIGRIPVDIDECGADYLTFSGEAIHAPSGVGIFLAREKRESGYFSPCMGLSESGGECPEINLPALAGMGKALELAVDALDFEMEDVRELRDRLEGDISKISGIRSLVPWSMRLPNTLAAAFEGVHSEAMLYMLNREGIAAFSGTAFPYSQWPGTFASEDLGMESFLRYSIVSFALSRFTSAEEIEYVSRTVERVVSELRELSGICIDPDTKEMS